MKNSGDGGIIKNNIELFAQKSDNNLSRIAITENRFEELTIEARKKGAISIRCKENDDIFKHLEENNATASRIGNILLFRQDATVILQNATKYGVPRSEIEEIRIHLRKYKQELEKYYEEG